MITIEYMKRKQKELERKRQRAAELEAKKEAARVAKMEAEARKQEEIAARKKLLLEQQEAERLRQKHIQRKEKLTEQKWDKQFDTLLAQIKDRRQKDNKLEEIRVIIQNREPSLQELDWDSWLSNPLNQKLADLDFEHAMEMFKRDNLMANRRKRTGGKKKANPDNYSLTFTGNTDADAAEDYVTTTFDPDDYNLNTTGFTLSYWVRPDELGNFMFALGRQPSASQRFEFGIYTSTKMFIGVGSGRKRTELHGMSTGNWYHWAITYAGNNASPKTLKAYRDGTEVLDTTATWSSTGGDAPIYFGARNDDGPSQEWACGLDEVAIYDTAKDSDWVTSVYNGETNYDHRGQSGLVGYWKFNEGGGTTVEDLSGEGNHGTFAAISGDTTAYPTWGKRYT